ncbi:hypothetical protein, variant [Aphanomyces invadans]|uniref:Uncharacterized protein n=1 Tax=Aphanomyces invadans TaxID=157072 RepID=A0A024UT53_9STRA|nr:hypothetical protein, variant [Aphanomyces invadans]ETW09514.1 hypothetical protein, variant [Aphanomyces invadans]|eukprot:XP_008860925.1 hypothetical protein, variant [Aphanomyces invadans]
MPPKWAWTPVPPSQVSPLWQIAPDAIKPITLFSVKFKQLASFESLQLSTPQGSAPPTPLPFPLATVVVVDGSINRMRSLRGIEAFPNVRELLLSLNQLSTLPSLHHLELLRVLHVGNNYLTSLSWIWHPNVLVHLNVSGNEITTLDGIAVCSGNLQILNVSENKLASLDGVQHLIHLRELWAQANHIQDAGVAHAMPLSRLQILSLGQNQLANLDAVAHVVMTLPSLENISFLDNPVTQCEAYRMRLCQHPGLRVVDSKTITVAMRQSFDRLRNMKDVDKLVEHTTIEYLAHIDAQKHVLDEGIRVHRAREQRMFDAYTRYKHSTERELEDCVQFAHVLTTRNRTGYLMSNAGLEVSVPFEKMANACSEGVEAPATEATSVVSMPCHKRPESRAAATSAFVGFATRSSAYLEKCQSHRAEPTRG